MREVQSFQHRLEPGISATFDQLKTLSTTMDFLGLLPSVQALGEPGAGVEQSAGGGAGECHLPQRPLQPRRARPTATEQVRENRMLEPVE